MSGTWLAEFERRLRVVVGAADDYLYYDANSAGWLSDVTPSDDGFVEVQWHHQDGRTGQRQFELGELLRAMDAVPDA